MDERKPSAAFIWIAAILALGLPLWGYLALRLFMTTAELHALFGNR